MNKDYLKSNDREFLNKIAIEASNFGLAIGAKGLDLKNKGEIEAMSEAQLKIYLLTLESLGKGFFSVLNNVTKVNDTKSVISSQLSNKIDFIKIELDSKIDNNTSEINLQTHPLRRLFSQSEPLDLKHYETLSNILIAKMKSKGHYDPLIPKSFLGWDDEKHISFLNQGVLDGYMEKIKRPSSQITLNEFLENEKLYSIEEVLQLISLIDIRLNKKYRNGYLIEKISSEIIAYLQKYTSSISKGKSAYGLVDDLIKNDLLINQKTINAEKKFLDLYYFISNFIIKIIHNKN